MTRRINLSAIIRAMWLHTLGCVFASVLLGLAAPASAVSTRIWDGSSGGNWMDLNNWVQSFGRTPVFSGDALLFGPAGVRLTTTNDFAPETDFSLLTFTLPGYRVRGNAIDLTGGITVSHAGGFTAFDATIRFTANQRLTVTEPDGRLLFQGWVSNNANLLYVKVSVNGSDIFITAGVYAASASRAGVLGVRAYPCSVGSQSTPRLP